MKVGNAMAILHVFDPLSPLRVNVDGKVREIESIGYSIERDSFEVVVKNEDSGNG